MGLLISSVSCKFSCTFLRICAFLLVVQFITLELLVVMSYEPLCFYSVSCHFSFFISSFIDLSPLPFFFLMSLCESLPISIIFSKNQLLVSLIFFCYCLHSHFIYFCSNFYDFFPSTNFAFCFFFL